MADIKYISVLAVGNPAGNAGVGPIVMYNNPQFNVENDTHGGLSDNDYYFSVKIENNYTVYKLIKNNVRSLQAIRAGYLAIAFSIPRGYELVASTPYQVLMELWKDFRGSCLTLKDPVLQVYEFNSKNIDTSVLNETAKAFSLRQTNKVYRPMDNHSSDVALIVQPDDKIKELLKDVQYPEFSPYKEILIAESASNSTKYKLLSDIQIPRLVSYSVIVDGSPKEYVADKNYPIKVTSDKDSAFYQNKTEIFTISDISEGKDIPGITIDEANEQISVSTIGWATPITKEYYVHIVPKEYENKIMSLLDIKLPNKKNVQLSSDNFAFTLVGEEIAYATNQSLMVTIKKDDRYGLKDYRILGNKLQIDIDEKKHRVNDNRDLEGNFPIATHTLAASSQTSLLISDIKLLFSSKKLFGKDKKHQVEFEIYYKDEKNIKHTKTSTKVDFVETTQKQYESHIRLVTKEYNKRYYYLSFENNNVKYTSRRIDFQKGMCELTENDFTTNSKPFWKSDKIVVPIIFLVVFFMGCFAGYVTHDYINKQHVTKDSLSANTDEAAVDSMTIKGTLQENEAIDFLDKVKENFKQKKDLSFDEIEEFYNYWNKHASVLTDVDNSNYNSKICNQIKDYHAVKEAIENGDIEEMKNLMLNYQTGNLHIYPQHAQLVLFVTENIDATNKFMTDYSNVKRFIDLERYREHQEMQLQTGAENKFPCNKCSKNFHSERELKEHKKHVHTEKAIKFTCKICGSNMFFSSNEELENHMKSKHNTER